MKTVLLCFVVFFSFTYIASAQFAKGDVLLGGSLNFNSGTSTLEPVKTNSTGGNFGLSAGKAINETTVIGIMGSYGYTNYKVNSVQGAHSNSFGVGIFYRKYKSLGNSFYLFGEAAAGYSNSKNYTNAPSDDFKTYDGETASLNLTPGLSFKASKVFFIELTLPNVFSANYTSYRNYDPNAQTPKNTNFSIGTSLNGGILQNLGIGFRLIL